MTGLDVGLAWQHPWLGMLREGPGDWPCRSITGWGADGQGAAMGPWAMSRVGEPQWPGRACQCPKRAGGTVLRVCSLLTCNKSPCLLNDTFCSKLIFSWMSPISVSLGFNLNLAHQTRKSNLKGCNCNSLAPRGTIIENTKPSLKTCLNRNITLGIRMGFISLAKYPANNKYH